MSYVLSLMRVKAQMKRRYHDGGCVCFIIPILLMTGCAMVKPYEREYLADPLMNYESTNKNDAYEQHMHRALLKVYIMHGQRVAVVAVNNNNSYIKC